ncbi:glycoside hydrolase domain-containing protein [Zhouia sp. PK063]|uniref:glycoside hydrolase domain-containing protein n=1 Tax=Zhouia sp. PK063 TaxID=3373602 RepID=UPI0037A12927
MKKLTLSLLALTFVACQPYKNQSNPTASITGRVNTFLGSSGDHGQMSPSASSPFNMMSIGPATVVHNHTGYEYYAKRYLGFVHTHLEGVGCTGSGGNILVKPILNGDEQTPLIKKSQKASPAFYSVDFEDGIAAEMSVKHNFGIHHYTFPKDSKSGLMVDLGYAFVGRFVKEAHTQTGNVITGYVDTQTTCSAGVYRIYFALEFTNANEFKATGAHKFIISSKDTSQPMDVKVGFSSVSIAYAKNRIEEQTSVEDIHQSSKEEWNSLLGRIKVTGEQDREDLFYSLLYRGLQSPYVVSEADGTYPAIDGSIQKSNHTMYSGWAIWDNYREQLPMLSLIYTDKYGDIAKSIANLFPYGKKNWATMHEPAPTVRTEHALVVLLDAYNKGYDVNLKAIKDSLLQEAAHLDYGAPDKALESSYDSWAMAEISQKLGDTANSKKYMDKALAFKNYWTKDFADLSKHDIDRMQARGLYQGTIWQYRWFVPFDVKDLKDLAGGEEAFTQQLDQFFADNDYNHANQPDLQVPGMYNATKQPWKSQKLYRNILLDTVVQNYFNDNSKGIDPYVGRIYNNRPRAYLRTMDDDAGTMSSWFVMRSMGLSPANIGNPIYYLTAPIFKEVTIHYTNGKQFQIKVTHYNKDNFYIKSVTLNGKSLERNWLTQDEIVNGGTLEIETDSVPNKNWGTTHQWISHLKN